MSKPSTDRNLNVQTPGATPKPADKPTDTTKTNPATAPAVANDPIDPTESKDKATVDAVETSLTDSTLGTNRAETGNVGENSVISNQNQPEVPAVRPSTARKATPDYKTMRAADVNPDELTAAVLTLDGWVVPTPKESK